METPILTSPSTLTMPPTKILSPIPFHEPMPLDRGLRLLSIDAGYSHRIGAMAAFHTIRLIMKQVAEDEGVHQDQIQPWEYFDMIGGSGEGGLIALLLGRFKMTLEAAWTHYTDIRKAVYPENEPTSWTNKDRSNALMTSARALVVNHTKSSSSIPLKPIHLEGCRTFVLGTYWTSREPDLVFRTYPTQSPDPVKAPRDTLLCEAVYVTMADRAHFESIAIPEVKHATDRFFGVGIQENPIKTLLDEARRQWPNSTIACLLSIGSGWYDKEDLSFALRQSTHSEIQERLRPQSSPTWSVDDHSSTSRTSQPPPKVYRRFNVHGMGNFLQGPVNEMDSGEIHVHVKREYDQSRLGELSEKLRLAPSSNVSIEKAAASVSDSIRSEHLGQIPFREGTKLYNEAKVKKLYTQSFFGLKRGLPIWRPDRYRKPFEIGDLGYFDSYNRFTQLFNIAEPREKQTKLKFRLPTSFDPLELDDDDIMHFTEEKNHLFFRSIGVGCEASGSRFGETGGTANSICSYNFTLSGDVTKVGVALITGDPIFVQYLAARQLHFEKAIRKHAHAWYAFNSDGGKAYDLHDGDLHLTTAVYLQEAWAIGYFGRPISPHSLEALFQGHTFRGPDNTLRVRGNWPEVEHENLHLRAGGHSAADNPKVRPRLRDDLPLEHTKFDQCIFMKGYKIRNRKWRSLKHLKGKPTTFLDHVKGINLGFPKKKKQVAPDIMMGAAGPQDLPPPPPPDSAPALFTSDSSSPTPTGDIPVEEARSDKDGLNAIDQEEAHDINDRTLVDALLDYIFKTHSTVDIAFAHDDHIPSEYEKSPDALFTYANLLDYLEKQRPPVYVDPTGVASLSFPEGPPQQNTQSQMTPVPSPSHSSPSSPKAQPVGLMSLSALKMELPSSGTPLTSDAKYQRSDDSMWYPTTQSKKPSKGNTTIFNNPLKNFMPFRGVAESIGGGGFNP